MIKDKTTVQPNAIPARCIGVDEDAAVYAKYREEMMRYATTLVGPSDAEDVVSTVVLRAITRHSLANLDNARGYLLKAVLNEARGRWRRKQPLPLIDAAIDDVSTDLLAVTQAVWRLPIRQRAAVFFHYWEGLRIDETAEMMGVGPGTVKRYLFLARQHLKGALS